MRNWMVRGLVFAGLMVVLRLIQGTVINAWPTMSGLISVILLLLFIAAVSAWGVRDGRADANANPDPDRREDLAMTWLLAGIAAGILSGAVSWLISLLYKGLYTGGPINELTTFAAFTALIIFVPAIIGVAVGRWLIDRKAPEAPHHDGSHDRPADTDVFSAVRADESPTGEIPVQRGEAQTEARTAAVATAERGERTEELPTHEGRTEALPTHEARTEAIDTRGESPTQEIRLDPDATQQRDNRRR
ncbi:hypothetical protein A9W99_20985 [Mycobacterium sp. 1164966.3]|uniref:B-4DMT family transporter n=1 Tax=Mycobacterium sp. 1164966.3 TaxID=1856861 RepID=UPI0007FD02E7|nr:B-4DMT family transporter [Mycobacterium sp. 1164966.3]OBA79539.1 hypothetical protein A9W99_20985 [Mycobacterium sp. 1164966.3]